ncbi:putative nuclease of RNase H fold, RuvC/YqgF family [Haloferax volcanii]|nr:putative nuclease of RNase H fold, RuvC/YqgF family [Haloferax alexandrinus]
MEYISGAALVAVVNDRTSALDSVVFGVDIQSGDIRGDSPSYALVVLDTRDTESDEVRIERDVVSFRKLRRLIERDEPRVVATDNMYELATDKDDLVRFLRWLPHGTQLVQVTGAERPEPLSRVASRHGVPYGKDPMKEAEAAARLALGNVGYEVAAFENTTTVKVSRGRSTGKGGWSQDRYTRRIHGSVKQQSREVESALKEANLDYERDVTEKYGGYSQALFTVEARPEDIPVSTHRSGDTRVEIERERRDGIEFEPLVKRRDRVIVGIDPGTTTAVAVVGLDGRVLDVHSTRTADTAAVIEWLIERGRPSLVAADVQPMPETVEKFRRSFDAAGWAPASDIPVDEKLHRTREVDYENDHERDALAAALFAFDDHEDQFERISRKVPADVDREEVIARVLTSEESVEAVLREMDDDADDGGDDADDESHEEPELTPEEREIRELRSRVERLESHVEDLKSTIEEKDETIEEYKDELSDARREERREARERREVTRLERENGRLERKVESLESDKAELADKLDQLKSLWKLDHSNFADVNTDGSLVPVKIVEQFTNGALDHTVEEYGIAAGDVVYLRDASGAGRTTAERLAEFDPKVVLRSGNLSEVADEVLFEADVPVAPADGVTIQEIDELAVAKESEVESAISDWEDRAEERQKEQREEMVDQIISEHRAENRRG